MRPSAVKSSLKHLVERQRPAFIWGPPGAGKSDVVASVAEDMGVELRDVRLNLMDPVDLKGFPVVKGTGKNQQMAFVPPDFLPTKGKGILFLDEMNSAPQSVQAAAYGLILNRRLGDYVLPDGWAILAAGNRSGDRGVVNTMPSPLANRLVHIDFEVDVDDWFEWATVAGVSDITRAFIKFRPGLLHSFNPATNERAFPTPRSWHFVDDVTQSNLTPDIEFELIKGTVGEGAAAEYLAFARTAKDLPSVEEILLNPDTAPIPSEPAGKYAVCTMLDRKTTPNSIGRMLQYIERMTPEFQVLYVKSAVTANRALTKTKEFISWTVQHQDILV
jgi:MoxR-like ATPase